MLNLRKEIVIKNILTMVKSKSTVKKKASPKQTISSDITHLLNTTLVQLKESLGEKKFEKRLKKAVKVLTHGVKLADTKKKVAKKEPVKKAAKKVVRS
jgi:hypothetical protein